MEGGKTPRSRSLYRSGWSSKVSLNSANACSSETRVAMATSGQASTSFARASTSWLVAFGMNASTLTSSRTEPIMLWMWALTSRPSPKTRMQINVVVTAVKLMGQFRRRLFTASPRKNPRLNLPGVSNVLGHGPVRKQLEVLKNAPDSPAQTRDFTPRHGREPGAVHVDGS